MMYRPRLFAVALALCAVAALLPRPAFAQLFFDIPDLSQSAKDALVVHFDGRIGVSVSGSGGVTAWEGRDGNGNAVVTANRAGNAGDDSLTNNNITRNAGNSALVFTESDTNQTAHLLAQLFDINGSMVTGGEFTIFWLGSYSGSNPQGNGTLGRYAYNLTTAEPNVLYGGFNHQRRNAAENAGAYVQSNTGGGGQTLLGGGISGFNDTPTVWTSLYNFTAPGGTLDFFATDSNGNRSDLNVSDPSPAQGTQSFASTDDPYLYIGAVSHPFGLTSSGGGYSFIGEMKQLILFEGRLDDEDIAAVEAWLVGLGDQGGPPVIEEPDPLFVLAPGLSPEAREALVGQFHSASGVTTDANGTVIEWAARDGDGETALTAVLGGSGSPGNITRNLDGSAIVFTESLVSDTMYLHTSLEHRVSGGDFTVFWRGHYSGANPQGDGLLGRYAYNMGIRQPGASGNNPGLTHQRRNADGNVASFPGSQTTYLGDSIAAYNDTETVWTTLYEYVGEAPFGTHRFFATDSAGDKVDLNMTQPTAVTAEFDTYRPHLYLGAYNDGVTVNAAQGGFTFIGEMSEFILFDRVLDEGDIAVVEAHLRGLPALMPPVGVVDPATPGDAGMLDEFILSVTATDTEGLDVEIQVDWGDGRLSDWSGPAASGTVQTVTTNYPLPGTFDLRMRVRNANGVVSNWHSAGSVTIMPNAAWPGGLVGMWLFDDPEDPLAAAVGDDLVPVGSGPLLHQLIVTDDAYVRRTLEGVVETPGGIGNYLLAAHGIGPNGGGSLTNVYTIVMDVLTPSPRQSHIFYQADPLRSNEGLFQKRWHDRVLGADDIGFSSLAFPQDEWRRLVVTVDLREDGFLRSYVDGVLYLEHAKPGLDSAWALDPDSLVLLGGSGEESGPFKVAAAAIFDRALDPVDVLYLGGPGSRLQPEHPNTAPSLEVITGPPSNVATGELTTIVLTGTDAESDRIQMRVDWGDQRLSTWSTFTEPGTPVEFTDNWIHPGARTVRAQVRDQNGASSGWTLLGEVQASSQPTPGRTDGMKVICYNVWVHFISNSALHETAGWLRQQNADFVGLQELVHISDQGLANLSQSWGHPFAVVARSSGSTVGLSSKHPIEAFTRHTEGLFRPIIQATTGGVEIFVVHLSFGNLSQRLADVEAIGPVIQAEIDAGKKVVVMGDFNSHMESDDPWLQGQTELPAVLPEAHLRDGYFDFEVMNGFLDLGLVDASTVAPGPDNITFPSLARESYRPQSLQLSRSYRVDFILVDEQTAPRTTIAFPRDRVLDFTSDHYPVTALIEPEAVVPDDGFGQWIREFPEIADSDPLGDPDNDGILNIFEYVLNGDPTVPHSTILPTAKYSPVYGMLFSFVRRTQSSADVPVVFQYSFDLVNWMDLSIPAASGGDVTIESSEPSEGLETVTIKVPFAENIFFGRLKVIVPQ